jgi:hypothetical protein
MITISVSAVNDAAIKLVLATIIGVTLLIYYWSYKDKSLIWLLVGGFFTIVSVVYGFLTFGIPFPQLIQVVP